MSTAKIRSANNVTVQWLNMQQGQANGQPMLFDGYLLSNKAASTRYLKIWDVAKAADVTVGTTPPDFTLIIPAGQTVVWSELGIQLDKGLAYVITTGVADTDTTAPAAGDVVGFIVYGLIGHTF